MDLRVFSKAFTIPWGPEIKNNLFNNEKKIV